MNLTRTQIAEKYGIHRSYVYILSKNDDRFPDPAETIGTTPWYDEAAVEDFFEDFIFARKGVEEPYSYDGKRRLRPHSAGLKITTPEKRYYESQFGTVGRGLRHLINKDMERLHRATQQSD